MNLLSAENLSKSYGEQLLFKDLSLGINQNQKIALIAKNGAGKTSLLEILAGKKSPDHGTLSIRKGLRTAYLPQEPELDPSQTVEETIFNSESIFVQVLSRYERALAKPENTQAYQEAFDEMERHQAWDFQQRYKQLLSRLKLQDPTAKVATLSGGQKRRLALAHILLDAPELLILDEPTNHLDLEMIEWLESYFQGQTQSIFMVTHDRYFLDRVCNQILELDQGKLYSYKGNYSYYLQEKENRTELQATEDHKNKRLYKKELEWMRKQPKARTTKSKSRIEQFEEIKRRGTLRRNNREVELEIAMERLGAKVIELHGIGKTFGQHTLFKNFSYNIQRQERLGIIGKNGSGKTTFLKILSGQIPPDSGKVVVGDTVKIGYYTQAGLQVSPEKKVIEVIRDFGDYIPLKKGRTISAEQLLERFLFERKRHYDFVEKLSGGERKRLYLCTILIQNPNFLILDEPTNDLDILTLNVLENFLMDFPGCLVVVSHDRYFMDKIVDHLFVLDGKGNIRDFPGNYSDFREFDGFDKPDAPKHQAEEKPAQWRQETPSAKLSYSEKREFEALETEIEALEKEKKRLEIIFSNPDASGEAIDQAGKVMTKLVSELQSKTERWFELAAKADTNG